jgi:hypothetical protein
MRRYVDASALRKLVIAEPESWSLAGELRGSDLVTSELCRVELARSLLRAAIGPGAQALAARALEPVELLQMDGVVLDRACEVGPPGLRALDAIHLASALTLGRELDAVVTYDRRLASAAEQVGLRVESPA